MPPIIFLNHFYTRAAVLGDLINICPFEQAKVEIGMPQAVTGADVTIPVEFQIQLVLEASVVAAREARSF